MKLKNANENSEESTKIPVSNQDKKCTEKDLSCFLNNRVKLMQEALKLVKQKDLKIMTPHYLKDQQLPAVKSLLLEELLGISSKRLRCFLTGETLEGDSSTSSDSQVDKEPNCEVISLDDISDNSDDNFMEIEVSEREREELEDDKPKVEKKFKEKILHKTKIKKEHSRKRKHSKKTSSVDKIENESVPGNSVMNALNLLELQARARAIRSQLANEITGDNIEVQLKEEDPDNTIDTQEEKVHKSDSLDSLNSVIFVSPKNSPVVMIHSDSGNEGGRKSRNNLHEKTEQKSPKEDIPNAVDDFNNDVLIVTDETILDKETESFKLKDDAI